MNEGALLAYVSPGLALGDILDRRSAYSIIVCNCLLHLTISEAGTNGDHVRCRQMRIRMPLAPRHLLRVRMRPMSVTTGHALRMQCGTGSAFVNHVLGIRRWAPQEKVIRPNARRVVALVANIHTIGDRAVRQFPGNPVRLHHLASMPYLAVSSRAKRSGPQPAFAVLIDLAPKPMGGLFWGELESPVARPRAELWVSTVGSEGRVAKATGQSDRLRTHGEPPTFVVPRRRRLQSLCGTFMSIVAESMA